MDRFHKRFSRSDRAWRASLAMVALFAATLAGAQIVPPASAPQGRDPANAPSPASTATSPGTSSGAQRDANSPTGPSAEQRESSPGTPAAPRGLSTPTRGIPPKVVAPEAGKGIADPVEADKSIAPTDPRPRVRYVPALPATRIAPVVPAPSEPGTATTSGSAPVPATSR